jgi:hypothetical protein
MSEKTMYGVTAAGNQLIAAGNQSNVYIYIYIKKKKEKSFFETLRLIGDTSVSPAFHLGFCQRLWLDWVGQSHRLNFDV